MARSITPSLPIRVSILYDSDVHPPVAVTASSNAKMLPRALAMT
jgi:hypothetical protein